MNDEYVPDDLSIFRSTCTMDACWDGYSSEEMERLREYYDRKRTRDSEISAGDERGK